MLVLQPEVVERAALEALGVEVRDELSSRDAPVERRVVAALRDGAVQPRRSLHVRVEEARHRDPRRVPVRQHPVLHAPEPVVADELHARPTGMAKQQINDVLFVHKIHSQIDW